MKQVHQLLLSASVLLTVLVFSSFSTVSHNDAEDYTRHVLNARRRYGATGFTLEKQKYLAKIDAAIALVLCYGAATQWTTPAHAPDSFRIY